MSQKKTKKKSSPSIAKLKRKKKGKRQQKSSRLKDQVLAFFKRNPQKSFTVKQLTSESGFWSQATNNKLRAVMDKLSDEGKLIYLDKGRYQLGADAKVVEGILQVNRSGTGFLLMEDTDDIFIPLSGMAKALDGDLVKVRMRQRRKREGRPEGAIIEVVKRRREWFVGTIVEGMPNTYFMIPDDKRMIVDFYIPKEHLNGATDGQKVVAKMLNWERRSPEGAVEKILGLGGEHNTEMHAIIYQYGFSPEFPPGVEEEAEAIPEVITQEEIDQRRDMREVLTFTIDPIDAKDFDDALSLRQLENGHWEVGVHIADVSYYVRPNTLLDQEAYQRATSVYLVDRTIPMLPEKLSNQVCSLRPNEEKMAFSAIFEMDENAKIYKQWIGRTVINSNYRFHYDEAQAVMDGEQDGPYLEELTVLNKMAYKLRAARFGKGSIEFETNEIKFQLDEHDKPVRVIKKERKDAHKLIEDFMLLANRKVARYIFEIFDNPPLPSVYRVHPEPDQEKLRSLGEMAGHFGHETNFERKGSVSTALNKLLGEVQNKPEKNIIETLAIRSMAKAVYSTKNVGHFGLGFEFYSHFTSPIRRYPDLLIHRLLESYQQKVYKQNPLVLEAQCKHCSDKERTAAEAERASIKYKQVEFLSDKIGVQFPGVISGVIEKGFFVEIEDNLCEGLVAVSGMIDDFYLHQPERHRFIGRDTGKVLQLGDKVIVEVDETDLQKRTIDLIFIEKRESDER